MNTNKLSEPLSKGELSELRGILRGKGAGMDPIGLDGFFTGVATRPMMLVPSGWIPLIMGDLDFPSEDGFTNFVDLVLRRYNQVNGLVADGGAAWPAPSLGEQEISDWCRGYMEAASSDPEWLEDEWAATQLLPISLLAEDENSVGGGGTNEHADRFLGKFRKELPQTVRELYDYWAERRRAVLPSRPPASSAAPKVGRNDPCSCGSGKKYKKCCANQPSAAVGFDPLASQPTEEAARESAPRASQIKRASQIDKELLDKVYERLNRTLVQISDELGVSAHMRRTTYSGYNARIELEVAVIREDGVILGKDGEEFLTQCGEFGLQSTDLGRTFSREGEKFRIIGLRPRAKLPVLCQSMKASDPVSQVRMGAEAVRTYLEQEPPSGSRPRLL